MGREAGGRKAGVSLLRVLGAVAVLVILGLWTMRHANFVLGRSLLFAFPGWEVTYRSAWPRLTGGVTARDVTMIPPDGDEAGTFHFDSVRLGVPFVEYYRSGFSRERGALLNAIRNLHFEFDGGHGDLSVPFTRELALFGDVSAAPFEAEGCMSDSVWIEAELGDMGLRPGGTQLVMDYRSAGNRLIKAQTLHTPGAGRVDFRREMIRHDDFSLFSLIETGRSEVASDEWHVSDDGFVGARNRHCEIKDKVGSDEFVQRHLRSVDRLLEAVGLAPGPELEQAYRTYATQGGSFDLVVHYDPPIGGSLYAAEDMGLWLPRLRGNFSIGARSIPLTLASTPVRALSDGDDVATTYELVVRESAAAAPAADPAAAPAPVPSAARTLAAEGATPRADPVRPRAPDATVAPSSVQAQSAESAPAGSPAAPVTKYSQLANYAGRKLTVYLRDQDPVRVEILRVVDAGNVLVRRGLAGGHADYVLDRSRFDHAEE